MNKDRYNKYFNEEIRKKADERFKNLSSYEINRIAILEKRRVYLISLNLVFIFCVFFVILGLLTKNYITFLVFLCVNVVLGIIAIVINTRQSKDELVKKYIKRECSRTYSSEKEEEIIGNFIPSKTINYKYGKIMLDNVLKKFIIQYGELFFKFSYEELIGFHVNENETKLNGLDYCCGLSISLELRNLELSPLTIDLFVGKIYKNSVKYRNIVEEKCQFESVLKYIINSTKQSSKLEEKKLPSKCPNCGAKLERKGDVFHCPYCNNEIYF